MNLIFIFTDSIFFSLRTRHDVVCQWLYMTFFYFHFIILNRFSLFTGKKFFVFLVCRVDIWGYVDGDKEKTGKGNIFCLWYFLKLDNQLFYTVHHKREKNSYFDWFCTVNHKNLLFFHFASWKSEIMGN